MRVRRSRFLVLIFGGVLPEGWNTCVKLSYKRTIKRRQGRADRAIIRKRE